jgi:2-polyprenyl-3-methyl-5-hydroxy-6-metoxy-1,4-benzoquinol methylase
VSRPGRYGDWDGAKYQERFDALAASGVDVHGEVDFVAALAPRTVLDAGCGTGRVARELAKRGVDVVGVDAEPSMIAEARQRDPELDWRVGDLTDIQLDRTFDVVLTAGNVLLFTVPGTNAAVVAGCARHVAPDGVLISGFQLGRGYELAEYDEHCRAVGFALDARWATWDRDPFPGDGTYSVSVHRRV